MKLTILIFASLALASSFSINYQKTILSGDFENSSQFEKFFSLFSTAKISQKLSAAQEQKIVDDYAQKFAKNLGRSRDEIEMRTKIILENFYKVREHNEKFSRGEELYQMEMNKFSDLTREEMEQNWMGLKIPADLNVTITYDPLSLPSDRFGESAPESWNWVDQGIVQPVQDQKNCGSCYAFAAIAAIEASKCRHHKECTKLSEQEAMECTNNCKGGLDNYVYDYAKKFGGCASNANYPYVGYQTKMCEKNGDRVPSSNIPSAIFLPNDAEKIKQTVYEQGPVWVAFWVFEELFSYHNGVYTACVGKKEALGGHAVLVTGYGVEGNTPYWIAKNSWGIGWGDQGYFKIQRGNNCASVESWRVSFPVTG